MGFLRRTAKGILPESIPNAHNDWTSITSHTRESLNIFFSYYLPKKSLLFVSEYPPLGSLAYKLSRLSGYAIRVQDEAPYDVVFKLEDRTFSDSIDSSRYKTKHVINGECTDISKEAVNEAFYEVFGYRLGVDPRSYEGKMVMKSNQNSTHDGTVIAGPIPSHKVREEKTYQKAIDNRVDDRSQVLDYRVPIHGDRIPLVYLKYRSIESRFSNENDYVKIRLPEDVFTSEETDKIFSFSRKMNMDFGELDVLRHSDGRIFIVDANSTPFGPPNGLNRSDHKRALSKMRKTFQSLIHSYAEQ